MTTSTQVVRTGAEPYRPPGHRLTFSGLVRSEWIKFWTVRSVVVPMVVAVICTVGIGAAAAALAASVSEAHQAAGVIGLSTSLVGAQISVLLVVAIGCAVSAGEYSTGLIRSSFSAVPRRTPVLWAKAVVVAGAVALVLGGSVIAAFFVGQLILMQEGLANSLGDAGVLQTLVGNVTVLVGVSLAGLGLGALLRSTAGAICATIGLLIVVPLVLMSLPDFTGKDLIGRYTFGGTTTALSAPIAATREGVSVGMSAVFFVAWVLLFLGCAAVVMRRRDI